MNLAHRGVTQNRIISSLDNESSEILFGIINSKKGLCGALLIEYRKGFYVL